MRAAEASGGTSPDLVKDLVTACLREQNATGSLLDFGAGLGELLARLQREGHLAPLAGADLFPRPAGLDDRIEWFQRDLNGDCSLDGRQFDNVVCSETIEHLENPRHTFRSLNALLKPGGLLVLTMPNQETIRAYTGLLLGGHFAHFRGEFYPAHITALLRLDLERLCGEVGLGRPAFRYTDSGCMPKFTTVNWQRISFGLLRGKLFSDNVAMVVRKPA